MHDEAQGQSFKDKLQGEDSSVEISAILDKVVTTRREVVVEGVVVVEHKDDRVEEDAEQNSIVEPFPSNQPHQTFPEFLVLVNTAQ